MKKQIFTPSGSSTAFEDGENLLHLLTEAPCDVAWVHHKIDAAIPTLCAVVNARHMLEKLKDRVLPSEREQFDAATDGIQHALSVWRGKGRVAPGICERCIPLVSQTN